MNQTALRLRVLPLYPARVTATNGITTERDGVDLVVKPDYGNLVQVPSVTNPDRTFFLAWDQDLDNYQSVSFTNIVNNIQDAIIGPPLAAIDAVNPGADQVVYFTDVGEAASYTASSFMRGVSNAVDAPALRSATGAALDATTEAAPTINYGFAGFSAKARFLSMTLGSSATTPDFAGSFQLRGTAGSANKDSAFKVALTAVYAGMPGAANGWAANFVSYSDPGQDPSTGLITQEFDINNNHVVSNGVDGNPYTAAVYISGTGTGRNDAAIIVAGSSNLYYDGIYFEDRSGAGVRSIEASAINDNSKSRNVLYSATAHEVGINFTAATFSSAIIRAPGFTVGPTGGIDAVSLHVAAALVRDLGAPASLTAPATPGAIQLDANYIYIGVGANQWGRTRLKTSSARQNLTAGSTTPAVANDANGDWQFNNGSAVSVTNFTGGYDGQRITILFNTANTTMVHNASLILKGAISTTPAAGSIMTLRFETGTNLWREESRNY